MLNSKPSWPSIALITASLLSTSCLDVGSETNAVARRQSLLQVSEELELQAPALRVSDATAGLTCGETTCLLIYSQYFGFKRRVYAERLDGTGSKLDSEPIQIPCAEKGWPISTATARGDEFLIVDGDEAWLLNASTKTVASAGTGWADSTTIVADAQHWYSYAHASRTVSVRDASLEVIAQVALPEVQTERPQWDWNMPRVIAGDGQVLVLFDEYAMRVSATGLLLEPVPVRIPGANPYVVAGAYHRGRYYVVYSVSNADASTRVVSAVIAASDGSLLNANAAPTTICDSCGGGRAKIVPFGDELLVVWRGRRQHYHELTYGLRLDRSGQRFAGRSNISEFHLEDTALEDLHFVEPRFLGRVGTAPARVTVTAAAPVLAIEPLQPILRENNDVSYPAAASNGQDFLAAWQVGSKIVATRVDGQSGVALDNPPVQLGTGRQPVIGFNGSEYLVAWFNDSYLERRLVTADGQLGPPLPPIFAAWRTEFGSFSTRHTQLVFDGSTFFLSYGVGYEVRYNSSSELLGIGFARDGTALSPEMVELASGAINTLGRGGISPYALLATPGAATESRTFQVLFTTPEDVQTVWFDSTTGARVRQVTTLETPGDVVGARAGSQHVVAVGDVAFTFNPRTGKPYAAPRAMNNPEQLTSLWYDGRSFVGMIAATQLVRFARNMDPLDSAGDPIVIPGWQPSHDFIYPATNGQGRSLIVYAVKPPVGSPDAPTIKGWFIDNDAVPEPEPEFPPEPEPAAAGAAGMPGMGGVAGYGGVAGLSGISGAAGSEWLTSGTGGTTTASYGEAGDASSQGGTSGAPSSGPGSDGEDGCGCRVAGTTKRSDLVSVLATIAALAMLRRASRQRRRAHRER